MKTRGFLYHFLVVAALLTLLLPLLSSRAQTDTIAPSTIANLSASTGATAGTVELSWVAPGDDASTGTAATYIVRYNTTTITESNWGTSIDVTSEPMPGSAGRVESMTVSGLLPGQVYHFAIKTQDETSNTSGISNSPRAFAYAPNNIYLPLVMSSASSVPAEVEIPDTTKILSEATTQYLSEISGDGTVFTFTQSTSSLEALVPGDVIVADATTNAPYGFLRKVTSISSTGGQIVIETTNATLEESIESGFAQIHHVLTPDQIQASTQLAGVSLVTPAELQDDFYLKLEEVVLDYDGNPDTKHDQVTVNGSIRLEPDLDFSFRVKRFSLQELSFITSVEETAELEIEAKAEFQSIDEEVEIGSYTFSPITVMVGPFPIVFVPVLTINVGIDGSVYVGLRSKTTQQLTQRSGLRYTGGVWNPIKDFSNEFYYSDPPTVIPTYGMEAKVYACAQLVLELYGVAGPYAGIGAYLELEVDAAESPWWVLYGGLEVPVGVRMEIFGRELADYDIVVIGYRLALAHAQVNNPPNLPFAPYPVDKATDQSTNVKLSWSGNDPDGDALTYSVYFEADDETPDVLVSDNQPNLAYDPSVMIPNTRYYWRVVAQDEHSATNAGPIWEFTTEAVDMIIEWDVWADAVISATILGEDNERTDPAEALGRPDYSESSQTGFVSLGGGELVADMGAGEEIVDAIGNDLRVCNPGTGSGETYDVYVSHSPLEGWLHLGSASGNGERSFDLGVVGVAQVRYVRVVDTSTDLGGPYPGVEIDYIAALHSNHDPYADSVISENIVGDNNQATDSTQALGFPDYDGPSNSGYVSLGGGGELIVDMGEGEDIWDGLGEDLRVYNPGDDGGEIAEIYVSMHPTGPWSFIGRAYGSPRTNDFDISSTGFAQIRYIRILDVSTGDLTDGNPAFDVDYIEALHMGIASSALWHRSTLLRHQRR